MTARFSGKLYLRNTGEILLTVVSLVLRLGLYIVSGKSGHSELSLIIRQFTDIMSV